MSEDKNSRKSWWLTIPGILTGTGTTIGAIAALIVALNSAGLFDRKDKKQEAPKVLQVDALVKPEAPRVLPVDALVNLPHLGNMTTCYQHESSFKRAKRIDIKATDEWSGRCGILVSQI